MCVFQRHRYLNRERGLCACGGVKRGVRGEYIQFVPTTPCAFTQGQRRRRFVQEAEFLSRLRLVDERVGWCLVVR